MRASSQHAPTELAGLGRCCRSYVHCVLQPNSHHLVWTLLCSPLLTVSPRRLSHSPHPDYLVSVTVHHCRPTSEFLGYLSSSRDYHAFQDPRRYGNFGNRDRPVPKDLGPALSISPESGGKHRSSQFLKPTQLRKHILNHRTNSSSDTS